MILTKTKKGTEDVKLDNEYIYDRESYTSQSEFNQNFLELIPTGTSSGDSIYINDSSDFPVKDIDIVGKTSQDTTSISGGDEYDSPSPQHPQTIHNVSGDIKEETTNANILKINRTDSVTASGVTLTPNGDGTFTINGTATALASFNLFAADSSTSSIYFKPRKLNLVAGKTYTLYGSPAGGISKYEIFISGATGSINGKDQGEGFTFTPTEAQLDINTYIAIRVVSGTTCNNLVFKPMIVEGTGKIPYIPYVNTQVIFPLAEGQKLMEGDYLADDGIHHAKGIRVFDGTENWIMNLASRFYLSIGKKLASSYGYCNKFSKGNLSEGEFCSFTYNTSNVYIRYDSTTTLADFKAWLAEQYANGTPLIVVYELENEVIDAYTEAQQAAWEQIKKLKTYKPITHITASSNDLSPNINIVYYKDLESVLNQINNAILSQGSNV